MAVKKDFIQFKDSNTLNDEHYIFTFHGAKKVGKSILALTGSKFFPKELSADSPVVLEDVMVWAFDNGALRGAKALGLQVPHVADFAKVPYTEIFDAVKQAVVKTAELAEKGLIKWLVCDTISKLDKKLKTYWREKLAGSRDKFALYDAMLASHQKFFETVNSLPCHLVFLCHSKANLHEDDDTKVRAKASGLEGVQSLIELDITGQAKDAYRGDSDMVAPVKKQRNGRGVMERVILPEGDGFYEGSSRWQGILDPKGEPAHLGRLMEKINA